MITTTVAGNVGRDVKLSRAGDSDVLNFSVASQHPKDKESTIWVDVAVWGNRGKALEPHIRTGDKITVVGQLYIRESEGRTYLKLDAFDIALQGGKPSGERDDRKDDRGRSDDRDRGRSDDRRTDSRRDDRRDGPPGGLPY